MSVDTDRGDSRNTETAPARWRGWGRGWRDFLLAGTVVLACNVAPELPVDRHAPTSSRLRSYGHALGRIDALEAMEAAVGADIASTGFQGQQRDVSCNRGAHDTRRSRAADHG